MADVPRYYLQNGDKRVGPFSSDQLKKMALAGSVGSTELVHPEDGTAALPLPDLVGSLPPPIPATMRGALAREEVYDPDDPYYGYYKNIRGVGGWLLVFCVFFALLVPAFRIFVISKLIQDDNLNMAMHLVPKVAYSIYFEQVTRLAMVLFGIVVVLAVLGTRPYGRQLALAFFVVHFLASILSEAAALYVIKDIPNVRIDMAIDSAVKMLLIDTVIVAPWWIYFYLSTRVKNTLTPNSISSIQRTTY